MLTVNFTVSMVHEHEPGLGGYHAQRAHGGEYLKYSHREHGEQGPKPGRLEGKKGDRRRAEGLKEGKSPLFGGRDAAIWEKVARNGREGRFRSCSRWVENGV